MPPEDPIDKIKKKFNHIPFELYGKILFELYQKNAISQNLPKTVPDVVVSTVRTHVKNTPKSELTLRSCSDALEFGIAIYLLSNMF